MEFSDYEDIEVEVDEGVAVIAINRPERRNSFTVRVGREIEDALRKVDAEPSLRAVVLTARGTTFCVGGDLNQGESAFKRKPVLDSGPRPPFREPGGRLTLTMLELSKPIVAAVNGSAVGIGLTMCLAADIRMISDRAKLGFPFASRGIVPDGVASWILPRLVGLGRALDWCLTGRILTADEALEAGLVHSVHPPEDVLDAAMAKAKSIARSSAPVSVAITRQLLIRMAGAASPADAHKIESLGLEYTGGLPDMVEGVHAFLERRDPRWAASVPSDLPGWYHEWTAQPDGVRGESSAQ